MNEENGIQEIVLEHIDKNIWNCELKLALFSAALLSYRKDTCLRPFPDYLLKGENDNKTLELLESLLEILPPLDELRNGKHVLSEDCWKLLWWLFKEERYFTTLCSKDILDELQLKTGKSSFSLLPDFIFEVKYNTKASEKFSEQTTHYEVKYGYHGSRMDNFYSIVSNGLQVHMMKNGIYGEGVYLSEDLAITMPYVSGGTIWKHSKLGHQVSCVAVCEILDHPGVKRQVGKQDKNKTINKSLAKNSEMGEVPEKYFVVTSSDLMRIKYLLLFTDKSSKSNKHMKRNIFLRYPVATILFLYLLFLIGMALWKSHSMKIFLQKHLKSDPYDD